MEHESFDLNLLMTINAFILRVEVTKTFLAIKSRIKLFIFHHIRDMFGTAQIHHRFFVL